MKFLKWFSLKAFVLLLVSCGHVNEAKDEKEAAGWYNFEFGEVPTPDISGIKAMQRTIRDSVVAWLAFTADQKSIDKLIARGFSAMPYKDFAEETKNANAPIWWAVRDDMEFYKLENWKSGYTYSEGFLAYDKHAGRAYFYHSAFN